MVLKILAFMVSVVIFSVGCSVLDISPAIAFILLYALSAMFYDHLDW